MYVSLLKIVLLISDISDSSELYGQGIKNCLLSLQVVPASGIPDGWMGLDIGPDSVKTFSDALATTKTVIWNGPMGVFEFDKFAVGTDVCKIFSFYIYIFHGSGTCFLLCVSFICGWR